MNRITVRTLNFKIFLISVLVLIFVIFGIAAFASKFSLSPFFYVIIPIACITGLAFTLENKYSAILTFF